MVPRLPLALLVVVLGLWIWDGRNDAAHEAVARLHLEGPAFLLLEGAKGSWSLEWPEWPATKGEPYLYVRGLPYHRSGEPAPLDLHLRVDPTDAVRPGEACPIDASGWFEAGNGWDFDTVATLVPGRARSVECEVRRDDPRDSPAVTLRIEGWDDGFLEEGLSVGIFLRNLMALVIAIPLCIWFGVAWRKRWKAARPISAAPQ